MYPAQFPFCFFFSPVSLQLRPSSQSASSQRQRFCISFYTCFPLHRILLHGAASEVEADIQIVRKPVLFPAFTLTWVIKTNVLFLMVTEHNRWPATACTITFSKLHSSVSSQAIDFHSPLIPHTVITFTGSQ